MIPDFHISRVDPAGPWILYGTMGGVRSLKELTFRRFIESAPTSSGIVELSAGSSALALEKLARERGLPMVAVVDDAGARHLRDEGFEGELKLVMSLEEGLRACADLEAAGHLWPRQMTNPALIHFARAWARRLKVQLDAGPEIRTVVVGFGTGVSAAALHEELCPERAVVAIQPAADQPVSGWRRYEQQNLGTDDVFHPYAGRFPIQTAPPIAGKGRARDVLLSMRWPTPDQTLVILHDGAPHES